MFEIIRTSKRRNVYNLCLKCFIYRDLSRPSILIKVKVLLQITLTRPGGVNDFLYKLVLYLSKG